MLTVSYASDYETAHFDYVRVHKPDGSIVETPVSSAIEMPAPVTQQAPLYSDLKVKQLPVRALSAGDVIDYQMGTVRTNPEVPGQFWGAEHFVVDAGVLLSQTLTLDLPADKYAQVWSPKHAPATTVRDGRRTYTWQTSQLQPTGAPAQDSSTPAKTVNDPDEDEDGRKIPSVAWTTFHSWDDVGKWYRSLAFSRSEPSDAIRSRATELTVHAVTPEQQVRALYDYVSQNIRYVGIDFGIGRYQPHPADEVLANSYGDCKDKDTLLEALLRAKGFDTSPALIGVGIFPVVDLPSPALFNHVITVVKVGGSQVWLDTTPETEPYRVLIPTIRDQLALVVPQASAASLQRTPADPPMNYFEDFQASGQLSKDGVLTGHMDLSVQSDNEAAFRLLLQRTATSQWDQVVQALSQAMGFSGTVSKSKLSQASADSPVMVTYDYSRPSFADWANFRILPLFPVVEIANVDDDKAPDYDIDLGALRKLTAKTEIGLPEGYGATLPEDVHVKKPYAAFDKTYTLHEHKLIVERTISILQKKVAKKDWKDYSAFLKDSGLRDGESYIPLSPYAPSTSASGSPTEAAKMPAKPEESEKEPPPASAQPEDEARKEAIAREKAKQEEVLSLSGNAEALEASDQWDTAAAILSGLLQKQPENHRILRMAGFAAAHQGRFDEAIQYYEATMRFDADAATYVVVDLAALYTRQRRFEDAESLLKKNLERNDFDLFVALADTQEAAGDYRAALLTVQDAAKAHSWSCGLIARNLRIKYRLNSEIPAKDIKNALQSCNAFGNSSSVADAAQVALIAADTGAELPWAESAMRSTIKRLEADALKDNGKETADERMAHADGLASAWEALGWVLFKAGKPVEAQKYLESAWVDQGIPDTGIRFAKLLTAMNKKTEALSVLRSVKKGLNARDDKGTYEAVSQQIGALGASGVPGPATDSPDASHIFPLTSPKHETGQSSFLVGIARNKIATAKAENEYARLSVMGTSLRQLNIPGAIPDESGFSLVRPGVLTCKESESKCTFTLEPHLPVLRSDHQDPFARFHQ